MDNLVSRAQMFATAAHEAIGQKRKYTGRPYWEHPMAVAAIVESVPHSTAMVAAAWLHDVVEDTQVSLDTIEKFFGPTVRTLVFWLTDPSKPEHGNRAKRKAIDRLHLSAASPEAQTIKLADLIDNTTDIARYDPDFAVVYLREKRELLKVMHRGDPNLMIRARQEMKWAHDHFGIGM